ncbi:undecaprenyldiphospho-muramoylpentapeptide beta-N-acetylglucosaminyltransferase [Enterococcus sp. LJL90]
MKILVTGGGTGGHIYPALAFVNYMKKDPENEFLYVGAKKGLETEIVPVAGVPFVALEIQGFKRKLSLDNLKTVQLFLKSINQAKKILKEFRPDIVLGTGGYVSGAVVYAASRLKIPTIIHEQNSVPGITNKFLSRYVTKIAIAFPDAAVFFPTEKVSLVGNPRGQEVEGMQPNDALTAYGLKEAQPTVLIFGGSQGALKINQAFSQALPELKKRAYQVLYASGTRYYEQLSAEIAALPQGSNVSIQPYIENMTEVMANASLLVGRAGATSIAEFTALGIPAVLIPSPYVTNDHQTKNAQSLAKAGAATIIADSQLDAQTLLAALDDIMDHPEKQKAMATAAKEQGISDASTRLENLIKEMI